ncbi:MAG TPA: response regulator, partial [Myxococcaceae bacterium]|nr:response regulator [Myxococcaceae bacterium]
MPKNVLVADDSITMRKVIGMTFAAEDFHITAVDNGIEAVAKARELKPDLVVADVTMPGKSGYEVCEQIKSDPSTARTPVLLLAGNSEAFDEARARAAKADGHIVKPFESQTLLDKVRS